MKWILTLLLIVTALTAKDNLASYKNYLTKITPTQRIVMWNSYRTGLKANLGYTLTAIAWKESMFGLYRMNITDGYAKSKYKGSFGVHHILLSTAVNMAGIKTAWSASRLAERLYTDDKLNATAALEILVYWRTRWSNNNSNMVWSRTVASYNAGTRGINTKAGVAYRDDILLRVKALKWYFKELTRVNLN